VTSAKPIVISAEPVLATVNFVLVFTNPIAFSTKAECVCEMPVEMAGEGKAPTTWGNGWKRGQQLADKTSSALQSLPKPLRSP
jgi:hypothetical protein